MERSFKHLESCKDPITEAEKREAYTLFRRWHPEKAVFPSIPGISTLRDVREGLHLTLEQVAERLGVNKSSYRAFETGEVNGTISINNLRKCAEAFNCKFVYEFRTNDGHPIDEKIWNEAFEETKEHGFLFNCVATRRAYALNSLIVEKLNEPEFRRKMGWSKQAKRFRPLYG